MCNLKFAEILKVVKLITKSSRDDSNAVPVVSLELSIFHLLQTDSCLVSHFFIVAVVDFRTQIKNSKEDSNAMEMTWLLASLIFN